MVVQTAERCRNKTYKVMFIELDATFQKKPLQLYLHRLCPHHQHRRHQLPHAMPRSPARPSRASNARSLDYESVFRRLIPRRSELVALETS